MKLRTVRLVIFLCLLFVLIGCRAEEMQPLSFKDVGHIEVSLEKNNYLVIRALPAPDSFAVITHYDFRKSQVSGSDSYFFTLYFEVGDKHPVPEIKYTKEGVEIIIPCASFDPKNDIVYYKDKEGTYKLNIGTYQTWQDYLKSRGLI